MSTYTTLPKKKQNDSISFGKCRRQCERPVLCFVFWWEKIHHLWWDLASKKAFLSWPKLPFPAPYMWHTDIIFLRPSHFWDKLRRRRRIRDWSYCAKCPKFHRSRQSFGEERDAIQSKLSSDDHTFSDASRNSKFLMLVLADANSGHEEKALR